MGSADESRVESGAGAPGGPRLLAIEDADAAARGVFDGLFGLVAEEVVPQAATGRSHGGVPSCSR